MPLVYLLILNYQGLEDTLHCIESIRNIKYDNYRILVLDNASKDGSVEAIKERYPNLEVLEMENNLGYAAANNIGIENAIQAHADYIGLLNNDLLVDENFLTVLIQSMEKDKTIGVTGPVICDFLSDTIQSAGTMINMNTSVTSCIHEREDYQTISKDAISCDYVCGACLLLRADLIEKVGYLPECYFLFFEEAEWCRRVSIQNYRIICLPEARVWHKESASVGSCSPQKMYYLDRNRVLFEKRNASRWQYFRFNLYNTLKVVYRSLLKPNTTAGMAAVWDGKRERVSPLYPGTYIGKR
ncbi:MAG TPA: glycosyltransferase family 2 protein [Lachnospiraceae bacterium]|nr:glycosyltransferase family 2 protein [Lachnospiraceae bacterium]